MARPAPPPVVDERVEVARRPRERPPAREAEPDAEPGARQAWPRRPLPLAARIAILALAYFVSERLGLRLAQRAQVYPLWPPAGVAVAGLLLFGRRAWPGVAIGGFWVGLRNGVVADLGTVVAQTVGAVMAATALRWLRFDRSLARVADVLALAAVAAVAAFVSATIATAVLVGAGVIPQAAWARFGTTWWVGDVMGIVLVTPVLLTAAGGDGQTAHRRRRAVETAVLLAATALATRLLFGGGLPLVFLVFPIALWSALRLGPPGAAALNCVVAGIAVWTTAGGRGPFAELSPTGSLVVLEAFNAAVALTSLVVAAAVATALRLGGENQRLHEEVRAQLDEVRRSRARIVEAGDVERRRVERNLHDGAQQRLVSLSCALGLAKAKVARERNSDLHATLAQATEELRAAMSELRTLAGGIHPAALTQHGLAVALESLAEQAPVRVDVAATTRRYPPVLEATAYFVVSEALANVAKHAGASKATVTVEEAGGWLVVDVADDGAGGAAPERGSGLIGLADRVAALQGRFTVDSPPGCGTRLRAELPCGWF